VEVPLAGLYTFSLLSPNTAIDELALEFCTKNDAEVAAVYAPYEIIQVGIVIKDGPGGSGIIYVDVTQPVDLSDLTSVERGTYQYGDILTFVPSGSYGVWRHTNQLSSSYGLTGSLSIVNGGITGSLFGTASFAVSASRAVSSSYALSSSFALSSG